MSKEDVERAVREAEEYAAEDKANREKIEVRNGADQAVYQCEKSIEELGDKLDASDKAELQGKIDALKETLKGDDVEAIKAQQEDLMKAFYAISEKIYKANAPEGAAPGPGRPRRRAGGRRRRVLQRRRAVIEQTATGADAANTCVSPPCRDTATLRQHGG